MSRKSRGPQFDVEAEIAKPREQAFGQLGLVAAVEMGGPEVPVIDAVPEHVVGRGQHRRGDGDDGLLWAPATLEAEELRPEVAVVLAGGGPRGLDERRLQPGIAGTRTGGVALARALVEPRTEPGPGDDRSEERRVGKEWRSRWSP